MDASSFLVVEHRIRSELQHDSALSCVLLIVLPAKFDLIIEAESFTDLVSICSKIAFL